MNPNRSRCWPIPRTAPAHARNELADAGHDAVIKPIPLRSAVPGGFTFDDFTINHDDRDRDLPERADPADHRRPDGDLRSRPAAAARSARSAPPAETGRATDRSTNTRRCCEPPAGKPKPRNSKTVYRQHRPMVERSIAWLTRGNRRVRYRGVSKNDHWLHHRVAAINLRRLLVLGLTRTNGTWAIATA